MISNLTDADGGGVVMGAWAYTVKSAVFVLVPAAPVQDTVYETVPATLGVTTELPDVGCVPDHPPEAVHDVAPLEAHQRVADSPSTIVLGFIAREEGGALATNATSSKEVALTTTVTVSVSEPVPPGPTHEILYVVVWVGETVSLPYAVFVPDHPPLAVQLVLFEELQIRSTD